MKAKVIIALVLTLGFISPQQATAVGKSPDQQVGSPLPYIQPLKPLTAPNFAPVQPLTPAAFPVAAEGTYNNTYDFGNCTWYVAGRKKVPDTWGNANTWASAAAASGITVSSVPIVGAIAQSTGGQYGHVAVVVGVGNGTVTVDEMNVRGLDVVDEATYPISAFNNYIYM